MRLVLTAAVNAVLLLLLFISYFGDTSVSFRIFYCMVFYFPFTFYIFVHDEYERFATSYCDMKIDIASSNESLVFIISYHRYYVLLRGFCLLT